MDEATTKGGRGGASTFIIFFANWRLPLNAGAAPLAAHQNNDTSLIGWLRQITARYGVFSCVQLSTKTLQSNCKLKRWHIRSKTSIKIGLHWVLKNQIESVESKQRRRRRSRMTCTIFLHLEMRLSAISTLHLGTLAFWCSSVVVSYELTEHCRGRVRWLALIFACKVEALK